MPGPSSDSPRNVDPKAKHMEGPPTGADLQSLELWYADKIGMADLTPRARLIAAAPDLADALDRVMALWDYAGEVTDSYCELCERSAPKNKDGVIVNPIEHDEEVGGMDCPYPKVKRALKKAGRPS